MAKPLSEAVDAGQAAMREVKAGRTPEERWALLRMHLTTKRLQDPDARWVRDALVEVMDTFRAPPDETKIARVEKAPNERSAPVQVGSNVTITPNDKGEVTGDPDLDKHL